MDESDKYYNFKQTIIKALNEIQQTSSIQNSPKIPFGLYMF